VVNLAADFVHTAESPPKGIPPQTPADAFRKLIDKQRAKSVQEYGGNEVPIEHGVMMSLMPANVKTGKPG
jgi:hypothetical protein